MPSPRRALVMGASGFVGSHVTRKLVERGDDVRVYLRKSSKTLGIDDLDVARCYGDLYDEAALRAAMADRDVVYYCVVDTRFHLRDPAPLFETNVNCLQRVLDIATEADLYRFVFCSTIGTIALGEGRPATEDDAFNWPGVGGPYIESRLKAEDMVLRYARERGLPAIALNVSNPYGPLDWQPNQGLMVKLAAQGKLPVFVKGVSTEVVGIEDVADAFLLAADHGRVGERYIVSETYMPMRELLTTAADEVGARPPRFGIPLAVMYAAGFLNGAVSRLLRRDPVIDVTGVRLLHTTSPADHGKATRELGWKPRPAAESIRKAARFHVDHAKDVARRG
ncbi:NAD-dependent epimerase/dehydratase family protein [Mycobacterium sp. 29Ha]|uniref:NAD-dependent epimerase/dehydratase family protein n=1 Tax=Mycobacterium sp. 29Ha TaxID=2939268 RepID=UPI00293916B2|nr:NAD-dependent epimerase/dehydratase family protein [Mycobacterium sp. 29Ha]MDV3131289.1 NAD-dependent epimerase/dehydratase family protein [Mycobacterium sp. 29Ha]